LTYANVGTCKRKPPASCYIGRTYDHLITRPDTGLMDPGGTWLRSIDSVEDGLGVIRTEARLCGVRNVVGALVCLTQGGCSSLSSSSLDAQLA
jgi:hypothetical protein